MTKKERALEVVYALKKEYPNPECALKYTHDYELLFATRLSAQCTDKRVNMVTKELFKKYNTPKDFANLKQEELEKEIKSCGFYHNKAKNIISCSKDILERFNGKVPGNIDDLMTLAGVGKKTANVVYSVGFGGDAIAVDTHVFRVSNRLGVHSKNPLDCEKKLEEIHQNQ